MSVLRRDETSDVVGPAVLLLWKKKWWIIIPAVLAFVAVFVVLRLAPERFKVSAEIFVNRLPAVEGQEGPSAGTVARLLGNVEVLAQVRSDYVAAFNPESVPAIEKWVERFDVETEVLQDTSVRKDLSPAITVSVESEGSSETRFIMESWLNRFVEHFGNYATAEAVLKRDALRGALGDLESQIRGMEDELARFESETPLQRRLLAEHLETLSASRLNAQDRTDDEGLRVSFNLFNYVPEPGLLRRLVDLQIDMETGDAPATAPVAAAAIQRAIDDAMTSVSAAQEAYAEVRRNYLGAARRLEGLKELKKQMLTAMNRFEVAATLARETGDDGLPAGNDVRALSSPVTPDKRVWPKRTVTSAGVAVGVALLATALVLAGEYVGGVRRRLG